MLDEAVDGDTVVVVVLVLVLDAVAAGDGEI